MVNKLYFFKRLKLDSDDDDGVVETNTNDDIGEDKYSHLKNNKNNSVSNNANNIDNIRNNNSLNSQLNNPFNNSSTNKQVNNNSNNSKIVNSVNSSNNNSSLNFADFEFFDNVNSNVNNKNTLTNNTSK